MHLVHSSGQWNHSFVFAGYIPLQFCCHALLLLFLCQVPYLSCACSSRSRPRLLSFSLLHMSHPPFTTSPITCSHLPLRTIHPPPRAFLLTLINYSLSQKKQLCPNYSVIMSVFILYSLLFKDINNKNKHNTSQWSVVCYHIAYVVL